MGLACLQVISELLLVGVCGLLDGKLRIKVSAPPDKGKANQCLVDFLAKQLGVKKNAVREMMGQAPPYRLPKV